MKRDPRVDPRPDDRFRLCGHEYRIMARTDGRVTDICEKGSDEGMEFRYTLREWRLLMAGCEVIHAAE